MYTINGLKIKMAKLSNKIDVRFLTQSALQEMLTDEAIDELARRESIIKARG